MGGYWRLRVQSEAKCNRHTDSVLALNRSYSASSYSSLSLSLWYSNFRKPGKSGFANLKGRPQQRLILKLNLCSGAFNSKEWFPKNRYSTKSNSIDQQSPGCIWGDTRHLKDWISEKRRTNGLINFGSARSQIWKVTCHPVTNDLARVAALAEPWSTQTVIWNTNTAGKSNGTQIRDFFLKRTNFSSQRRAEEEKRGSSHEFSLSQFTKSTVPVFLFYAGFWSAGKKSIDGIESQVGAGRRATGSLRFRWRKVQTINHQPQGSSEFFSCLSVCSYFSEKEEKGRKSCRVKEDVFFYIYIYFICTLYTTPKILTLPLLLTTTVYSPEKKHLVGNDTFGDSLLGLKAG